MRRANIGLGIDSGIRRRTLAFHLLQEAQMLNRHLLPQALALLAIGGAPLLARSGVSAEPTDIVVGYVCSSACTCQAVDKRTQDAECERIYHGSHSNECGDTPCPDSAGVSYPISWLCVVSR